MTKLRRQRLKEMLLLQTTLTIILALAGASGQPGPYHTQPLPAFQFGPPASPPAIHHSKQYNQRPAHQQNSNLVNQQQQDPAQSLPLTRQQQQQQDLDNVIESTTYLAPTPSGRQPQGCQLPATWAGKWYQSNKEPVRVTNTEISDKGLCRDQKGDKFLFESWGTKAASAAASNSLNQQASLICLVINERHLNVLQYKESSSLPIPANYHNRSLTDILANDPDHSLLDKICSDIAGDAQLESLFRLETPSIECPINGQFSFTYDNCRERQSSLDSCIDKKQLNFRFSACPDVPGSESKSEVLKCYADWSEGNNYYMIGRLEHASNHQDKGKFRCFVYERTPDGFRMAQSLEESCYGLINANEGPKTLHLTVKPPTVHKCHFPSYIQSQSENWLSVDNSLIYMFNQNSTKYQVKETKEGNVIEEAACLQQFTYPTNIPSHPHSLVHPHYQTRSNNQQVITQNKRFAANYPQPEQQVSSRSASINNNNDVVYLIQITKNCQTTNYCVRFYKRSNGIVQIDYYLSNPQNGDNQCRVAYFGTPQTQIITSTNLEHQRCPFEGTYSIDAPIESDLSYNPSNIFICPRQSLLTAQCDHPSKLRIHSRCSPSKLVIKNLHCLGSWTTGGLVRLLLADDERQRYSAWYKDYGSLQVLNQDGALSSESATTKSQQLMTLATQNQNLVNPIASIVDLQIALITPLPIAVKTMQVRLTRRNSCSDTRIYPGAGPYGGLTQIGSQSPMQRDPSSSAASALGLFRHSLVSSLILTVTTLLITL